MLSFAHPEIDQLQCHSVRSERISSRYTEKMLIYLLFRNGAPGMMKMRTSASSLRLIDSRTYCELRALPMHDFSS